MRFSRSMTAVVKLLAVIMIATTLLVAFPVINVSAADNVIITLDPGHGGTDPGNQSALKFGGNNEDFDNWEMTKYAKARLEQYEGVTVYLTRDTLEEYMPDIDTRVDVAKSHNSDAIISIHTNSADSVNANGIEILVPNQNWRPEVGTASKNCANAILNKYIEVLGVNNRGLKENNGRGTYEDGSEGDYFGINRYGKIQNIPVAMIVETGFASNQIDYLKVLQSDVTRMRAGYAIADGIAAYYNLSPKADADLSMPEAPDIDIPKTYNFWSSVDHVNGKGPNGTANFAGKGGNYEGGATTIDAVAERVAVKADATLSVGGWLGIDGGTARFVFSVDGGQTWKDATGGHDGEPNPGHYAGIGFENATKLGMFHKDISPIVADLSAYAGETLSVTFAGIAAADNETPVPFITIANYTVPDEPETMVASSSTSFPYAGFVDFIHGVGMPKGWDEVYGHRTGEEGNFQILATEHAGVTVVDNKITLSGGALVNGGQDALFYSVDGNNWVEITEILFRSCEGTLFSLWSAINGGLTEEGIVESNAFYDAVIDLSAHAGETVDVYVAVRSVATDNGAQQLCHLFTFTNVTVGTAEDTTEPEETTTEPEVSTAEPEVSTAEPEVSATEPEVSTAEPEVSATEPEVSATEPEVSATEPEASATEPEATEKEPESTKPATKNPEKKKGCKSSVSGALAIVALTTAAGALCLARKKKD